jgi:hypothetical protein
MTTITKLIASAAIFLALAAAPASASFDADDSGQSAYAQFGSPQNCLVNRPGR